MESCKDEVRQKFTRDVEAWPGDKKEQLISQGISPLFVRFRQHAEILERKGTLIDIQRNEKQQEKGQERQQQQWNNTTLMQSADPNLMWTQMGLDPRQPNQAVYMNATIHQQIEPEMRITSNSVVDPNSPNSFNRRDISLANPNHMDFLRPSLTQTLLDSKASSFTLDEDNAMMESDTLDTQVLMSPTTRTKSVFSRDTSIWEDISAGKLINRTSSNPIINENGNSLSFTEQNNHPFPCLAINQASSYDQQLSPVTDNSSAHMPTVSESNNLFGPGDNGCASFEPDPEDISHSHHPHSSPPLVPQTQQQHGLPAAPLTAQEQQHIAGALDVMSQDAEILDATNTYSAHHPISVKTRGRPRKFASTAEAKKHSDRLRYERRRQGTNRLEFVTYRPT
jgi:hypothetical protein